MTNWFSNAIAGIKSFFSGLQARQVFAIVLVGALMLTTNINPGKINFGQDSSKEVTNKVLDRVHENDSPRPKTTGEWQKEDRETANDLDERGRRISEQTGAAFKEFGSGYAKAMKDASKDAVRTGSDLVDQVK